MLILHNARVATMIGPQAGAGEAPLGMIEGGAVACDGEQIVYVGPAAGAPEGETVDCAGMLLTPGLVDPHTHLIFAGDRAREHAQRLAGMPYLEIARQGGGIRNTVSATRASKDSVLLGSARERLSRLSRSGVTTVEVKTGYGLSLDDELRLVRIGAEAGRGAPCDVLVTVLGLHAVPPGMDRKQWVSEVIEELIPRAAAAGASGCDAFLEQGAFDSADCRATLRAGIAAGLTGHLHADQLTAGGGAQLAAEVGCASADHLERTTAPGIAAMADAGVTAVLLPLAAWFLRESAAQSEPFLRAGVTVALGSNINPGTQPIESVSMLLAAGCLLSGLTPAQALWACTAGGARALRLHDRGALRPGLRADLVLFSCTGAEHLPYHAGVEHAQVVIRGGKIVHRVATPICQH
ncbi:MAG TPA: imidazolonepropionase [Myxococcales bacterium]|nr:imidazolonepropionase [Myxococcales bacterium]